MLGLASFILLLLNNAFANANIKLSLNSGWVPLTHADLSNQMKTGIGILKRNYNISWNQALNYNDAVTENAMKIVLPGASPNKRLFYYSLPVVHAHDISPVTSKIQEQTFKYPHEIETLTNIPDIQNSDMFNKTENVTETTTEHNQRQSKQMHNHKIVNDIGNLYDKVIEDNETEATSVTSIGKYINLNKYEVTEPSNVEELTEETDKNKRGYLYKSPVVVPVGHHPVRNEITKTLYNNLRKYNIKSTDMLNNYAVSKSNVNNYKTMFDKYRHHVSPVVAIPFRYNSLNHLPVNPLLAVFLSNYGYYTQGSYGPQNNYRNLYGYSASNNIHNNYPFGSYKIFSDTDSSH